jgi:hypothetical protein
VEAVDGADPGAARCRRCCVTHVICACTYPYRQAHEVANRKETKLRSSVLTELRFAADLIVLSRWAKRADDTVCAAVSRSWSGTAITASLILVRSNSCSALCCSSRIVVSSSN